ncbi:hypothetical protein [Streptomyces laurentii]|uniref:hypothetical protein n=1 Tax=Streptomyces laurentii TaxID=39478 RepID=UPI0036AD9473
MSISNQNQGTHAYVLTLADPQGQATSSGTITPAPGATRNDVYLDLRHEAVHRYSMERAVVVFFSLEPNTL